MLTHVFYNIDIIIWNNRTEHFEPRDLYEQTWIELRKLGLRTTRKQEEAGEEGPQGRQPEASGKLGR